MMPGDIPCEKPCHNALCHYCAFGQCMDNAVCERQMDENGNFIHKEDNQ